MDAEDTRDNLEFAIRDESWATTMQNGLESYMMSLYESVDAGDIDSPEANIETESGHPFCGCNVCEGREILSYTVPRVIDGYLKGAVGFYRNGEEVTPPGD